MLATRLSTFKTLFFGLAVVTGSTAQTTSSHAYTSVHTASETPHFRVAPRILVGKEWETLVVLLNPGAAPVSFQQAFFADGKPTALSVRSESLAVALTAPAIQGAVAPGARITLALGSAGPYIQEGWSLLSYAQGALEGYVILRRRAPGGEFSFETTIPLSGTQDVSAYMPFDNTQGFRSQLTLVNPTSDISATVRLTYLNPDGKPVLIDSVSLAPAEQLTLILPDTYPDLANKAGVILIETDTDRLSVVGVRQNMTHGVISTLPVFTGRPVLRNVDR
jgi:hypothetical protein